MIRRALFALGAFICCGSLVQAGETITELHREATKLAETEATRGEAIDKLKTVLDTHRQNEALFQDALKQLARCYEDEGRPEESIRFFISLVDEVEGRDRHRILRDIFSQFRIKHPEILEKVIKERSNPPRKIPAVDADEELANAITQRQDSDLREKALQKMLILLGEESPDSAKKAALASLNKCLTAKFDRAPFREAVIPLLVSQDPIIRMQAVRCLPALEADAIHLPALVPLVDDPSEHVRQGVARALISIGKGEHAMSVVPALVKLLADPDQKVIEQTIRSMWGQYHAPELVEALVELSRVPRHHHNAIYFGLSTIREKNVPVCKRLVEELSEPDWNNSGRAAWGLTYGVTEDAKNIVEQGLLKALPEETNTYTRQQEFRALRNVATEASRNFLESVVASDMESDEFRNTAAEILRLLERKR